MDLETRGSDVQAAWVEAGAMYGISRFLSCGGTPPYLRGLEEKELEQEVDVATSEIRQQKDEIEKEKDRSEELLLNILPFSFFLLSFFLFLPFFFFFYFFVLSFLVK